MQMPSVRGTSWQWHWHCFDWFCWFTLVARLLAPRCKSIDYFQWSITFFVRESQSQMRLTFVK